MKNVITLILAGGQGSRLYPLTKIRSKPAVPIAGRFRLIDISISNCLHSGLRKIFVLTQFSTESLHRHIFLTYRFDNFTPGFITILSAQQTLENRNWYQGTADAVRQNLFFIEGKGNYVLILSGDHLYRMDYRPFIEFHQAKGADITIAVTPVTADQAPELGIMKLDDHQRVISFIEKPRPGPELESMLLQESLLSKLAGEAKDQYYLASMGIYVFSWEVLRDLLKTTPFEDFGRGVIPFAIQTYKVYGYLFQGYWKDIGTIKSFYEANLELTQPLPPFNFYDEDRPIFTHARFLPGSKIIFSEVENSILCEGSIINRSIIRNSIIGIRSRIGENCLIENSIIMGADYFESEEEIKSNASKGIPNIGLGRNCEIRRAIIDKNARIGDNCRLVNLRNVQSEENENYVIRDGIIVVPKHGVIYPGTII
ncbi:MAG: glucose-1-phosphate adenylyltransferase [Candidatus Aminicenantes bacterium]|nr:glucose-1-phosphate adenylyltransferase [Candidatus Aminicenantes bacterium]